jgi:hypothetical protein
LGKAVVHEQNSDTWEFGKGALSVKLYSVAVLQCCGVAVGRGKEVRGWRQKEKYQMTNEKCQMSKLKIQMADDGVQATSTKLPDTDTKHEHESQCQSWESLENRKNEL